MEPPARAPIELRFLRAAVFAAVCVSLAALGHCLAGADVPGALALVAGWLAVTGVAAPLAGGRRSPRTIVPALFAGQLGLHVLFCLACAPRPAGGHASAAELGRGLLCGGTTSDGASAARAVHLLRAHGVDPAAAAGMPKATGGMPHQAMSLIPSNGMLAAHAAAALSLGLLLWRVELAVWALAVLPVAVALPRLFSGATVLSASLAGAADAARRAARLARPPEKAGHAGSTDVRHHLVRRGPPAAHCPA
ncbi:hypothetical protein [Streptomyces sp. TS71-3]|uniref:hypothetical protein n=1 Tax=Streptomyces sp. TS71-3 TaxID=2733862 RepID=UPI001BB41075|nr:hypothetical protein [Streptomyces sp. TS71-3]